MVDLYGSAIFCGSRVPPSIPVGPTYREITRKKGNCLDIDRGIDICDEDFSSGAWASRNSDQRALFGERVMV